MEFKVHPTCIDWRGAKMWTDTLGPGWRLPTMAELEGNKVDFLNLTRGEPLLKWIWSSDTRGEDAYGMYVCWYSSPMAFNGTSMGIAIAVREKLGFFGWLNTFFR